MHLKASILCTVKRWTVVSSTLMSSAYTMRRPFFRLPSVRTRSTSLYLAQRYRYASTARKKTRWLRTDFVGRTVRISTGSPRRGLHPQRGPNALMTNVLSAVWTRAAKGTTAVRSACIVLEMPDGKMGHLREQRLRHWQRRHILLISQHQAARRLLLNRQIQRCC